MDKEGMEKVEPRKDFDEIVAEKKKNKKRNVLVAVVSALVVIVLGVYFCFTKIFVLKDVKVEFYGEEIPYSQQEVIDASGLKFDTAMYEIDENEVINATKFSLPYVTVDVEKQWPSGVVLKVHKKQYRYYVSVDKKLYLLADDLVVLKKENDIQEIEKEGLVLLKVSGINECVEGEKIDIPDDIKDSLYELSSLLEKHGMLQYITEIDLLNKFDIKLNYDAKYHVKFGDIKNAEKKVQVMKLAIEDKKNQGQSGSIDVTDENMGVFRPY